MKRLYGTMVICLCLSATSGAQTIEDILNRIEQNNKELQANGQEVSAEIMKVQAENNMEDPSVEYSPFYSKGVSGMASSELVVSQGFDFPTLYAARARSGRFRKEAIERRRQTVRRDILLSAKNLCLDLILCNKQQELLDIRRKDADELLALYEERLREGDAGILDVNKIKMERMNIQTEALQNEVAHRTALQQLLAMNGNAPLSFESEQYPEVTPVTDYHALYEEMIQTDASLLADEADVQAAERNVSLNRQNWLPKLEVGYRRNTDMSEKSNGFLIGGSLPLFSNRKKLKIAKAEAIGATLRRDDARLKAEAQIQSLFNEMTQLKISMSAYDLPLLYSNLSLLKEAVTAGQLSIIDYYTEAAVVYKNIQAYFDVENRYQKVMAEIYKNRL